MSETSRNARRAARAKAHRLVQGNQGKVDASDYGPEEVLNADVKTGMRPISRRAFKKGGKVMAVDGEAAKHHAGKRPRRKDGGLINELMNRDYKKANEEREGKKHVGGMKSGGRAKKADGGDVALGLLSPGGLLAKKALGLKSGGKADGDKDDKWIAGAVKHKGALHKSMHVPEGEKIPAKKLAKAEHSDSPKLAKRARLAETLERINKRDGGGIDGLEMNKGGKATKGKTNINIVIATGRPSPGDQTQSGMPGGNSPVPAGVPAPLPAAPGAPGAAPVPMGAGMPPPGAPPPMPMPRKRGGRTYLDMDAGAGSGEGRLEKTDIQRNKRKG